MPMIAQVHLFGSVGILSGSQSLLVFRHESLAINLDMPGLLAIYAGAVVAGLAPIP